MSTESEGRPDDGAVPVFVDNSGGRRRTWRRLGLALGALGGGYALVVAVSVVGGNSEAPWGVLIPVNGVDSPGAARVVPERDGDARNRLPGATASRTGGPSPSASAPADNKARTQGSSSESSPAARSSAKKAPAQGAPKSGGTGGKKGGQGGTSSAKPPAGPANGGGSGSGSGSAGSTGGGAPTEPEPSPSESSGSPDPSPQGGILDQILDQLGGSGGGSNSTSAAGAE